MSSIYYYSDMPDKRKGATDAEIAASLAALRRVEQLISLCEKRGTGSRAAKKK